MKKENSWINKIINFLGYFFLILGFYALIKITFNYLYYKNNYPLQPVLGFNFYYQTEEDCKQQYNYPVYDDKGRQRIMTFEEKKLQEENIKICVNKVRRQREENKINDIWTTIFLLTLGAGIHSTKKFYLK